MKIELQPGVLCWVENVPVNPARKWFALQAGDLPTLGPFDTEEEARLALKLSSDLNDRSAAKETEAKADDEQVHLAELREELTENKDILDKIKRGELRVGRPEASKP